jgi:hypothetical protein
MSGCLTKRVSLYAPDAISMSPGDAPERGTKAIRAVHGWPRPTSTGVRTEGALSEARPNGKRSV